MVENIRLKIIESREDIPNIIDKNVGTLVNFGWHSGYPLCTEKTLDIDLYSSTILDNYPTWAENNWVVSLVRDGRMSQYIWLYPHGCMKDSIKMLNSKSGNCLAYNIRFNKKTKIGYKYIVIDMDFFGCKVPVHWSPSDRKELFISVLECLSATNLTLIISKSKRYINYDVEDFLEEINELLSDNTNVEVI